MFLLVRSRSDHPKLKLSPELLKFPCVGTGSSTILKVDLKNGYLEDVKVSGVIGTCIICNCFKKLYERQCYLESYENEKENLW